MIQNRVKVSRGGGGPETLLGGVMTAHDSLGEGGEKRHIFAKEPVIQSPRLWSHSQLECVLCNFICSIS